MPYLNESMRHFLMTRMCYRAHSQVSIALSISMQTEIALFTYLQCPHGIEHGEYRDAHVGKDSHPHRSDA